MQIDRDGTIVRTRVTRNLPVSNTPLQDVINALLQGPAPEESRRDLISMIPAGTRLIKAEVRGSTAYINFSENFLFGPYGVEGYAGQLRQIVWTATEFSNVNDVQILIEGRRVDYLGESIWIGSPVGRESR
jgi:spore germination protein GerM